MGRDIAINLEPTPVLYRHKKGGLYRFISEGTDSETLAEVVIYQSVTTQEVWVRPKSMFYDGRFTLESTVSSEVLE